MCVILFQVDHNVTESYLGWVNAGYSFGQLVGSVLFGYWSDKRRAIEPLLLSILLLIVGSGLYGYAEVFGKNGIYVVCAARVILGLSAGIIQSYLIYFTSVFHFHNP